MDIRVECNGTTHTYSRMRDVDNFQNGEMGCIGDTCGIKHEYIIFRIPTETDIDIFKMKLLLAVQGEPGALFIVGRGEVSSEDHCGPYGQVVTYESQLLPAYDEWVEQYVSNYEHNKKMDYGDGELSKFVSNFNPDTCDAPCTDNSDEFIKCLSYSEICELSAVTETNNRCECDLDSIFCKHMYRGLELQHQSLSLRASEKFQKNGCSMFKMTDGELEYLPEGDFETVAAEELEYVWHRLPRKYTNDPMKQEFRYCWEHDTKVMRKYCQMCKYFRCSSCTDPNGYLRTILCPKACSLMLDESRKKCHNLYEYFGGFGVDNGVNTRFCGCDMNDIFCEHMSGEGRLKLYRPMDWRATEKFHNNVCLMFKMTDCEIHYLPENQYETHAAEQLEYVWHRLPSKYSSDPKKQEFRYCREHGTKVMRKYCPKCNYFRCETCTDREGLILVVDCPKKCRKMLKDSYDKCHKLYNLFWGYGVDVPVKMRSW